MGWEKHESNEVSGRDRAKLRMSAIPSVEECLQRLEQMPELSRFKRSYLAQIVRQVQDTFRNELASSSGQVAPSRREITETLLQRVLARVRSDGFGLRRVVNATGVVIHTNLGRALLAEAACEAVHLAASEYVNLEFDLEHGGRGDRDSLVEELLCRLSGAEAATVVNNNAAAVLIALNTLAEGREVVVSRGELVEIGGSFRIPDVMARSGARLREVGTTNRTHLSDYADALSPETALLLKVHPSNYRIIGFASSVSLPELVALGRERGVPVMEDLGSGALVDFSAYGLEREPTIAERVACGADLVTCSGDKLLGGPQAGIILGRGELIKRIRKNPLKRALRCDKLTLAALGATLDLYLRHADPLRVLPTLRLLTRSVEELDEVAFKAREILRRRLGPEFSVAIARDRAEVGAGALPTAELETRVLEISRSGLSPDRMAEKFRRMSPPIIGRIRNGCFVLDMRTIEDPRVFENVG